MNVPYAYLNQQFEDVEEYFSDLRDLVKSGEFTLGPFVDSFEKKFAKYIGVKHAIGTNTGTGALILALKASGVKSGDEVITVANTFIATVGAIIAVGAKPVFVDCDDRFQMDVSKLEKAITSKTKAIIPVHWGGCSPDMEKIMTIANGRGVEVVEDACPSVGARVNGKPAGTFGRVNAFSMHPLKPLNVWGDGGIVVTNDDQAAEFLRLYRNHGLVGRDHIKIWGVNDRLQPFQAVVGELAPKIITPHRPSENRESYQLYLALAERRNELVKYLIERGIEAKIHYPIPIHLQEAAQELGYKKGDFPICEAQADSIITLPAHQYINEEQIQYMVQEIKNFYQKF